MSFRPKDPACDGCPARDVGRSFVRASGPLDAEYLVIGQGPGQVEAHTGMPFVGPSGDRLDRWLFQAKIPRHRCYILNVVQCWLPKDRAPSVKERKHCWWAHTAPRLRALERPPLVAIAVGVPAHKVLLGGIGGERYAGTVFEREWEDIGYGLRLNDAPGDPTRVAGDGEGGAAGEGGGSTSPTPAESTSPDPTDDTRARVRDPEDVDRLCDAP